MNIFSAILSLLLATQALAFYQNCRQVNYFKGQFEKIFRLIPDNVYPVFSVCTNENFTRDYHIAIEQYNEASKDPLCQEINFKRSKVNMVEIMHSQLVSVWEVANCQDCLDRRNETVEFFSLFDQLDSCINSHKEVSPCEPCAGNYSEVQSRYEQLAKGHRDSICFDIEDRMNQTRHRWSAEFNCCKNKQHSKKAFVAFASSLCSLPVIFYLVMYLVTRRKEAREGLVNGPLLDDSRDADEPESNADPLPSTSFTGTQDNIDDDDETNSDDEVNLRVEYNDLNLIREEQLVDLISNKSDSTVDVNLDVSGQQKPKHIDQDEDDVSILDAMKGNVNGRNLLD